MRVKKSIMFVALFLQGSLLLCGYPSAEVLQSDQDLLSEPKATAAVVGMAKKGDVAILEKKGFWVKVKYADATGWVKRSNIKSDSSSGGLGTIDTGRLASGNIVSTSGVRGLDGNDLVNAKADFNEFEKLEGQKVTDEQAAKFAREAGLKVRDLQYLQTAASGGLFSNK